MNALLKPIYPSEGEAESWWASLQRTIWDSPAAIVQDTPAGIDLQQQAAAAAATRKWLTIAEDAATSHDHALKQDERTTEVKPLSHPPKPKTNSSPNFDPSHI